MRFQVELSANGPEPAADIAQAGAFARREREARAVVAHLERRFAEQIQVDAERGEPLLCAVVEVPLDPATLGRRGRRRARLVDPEPPVS
jgi:hypothetical protein